MLRLICSRGCVRSLPLVVLFAMTTISASVSWAQAPGGAPASPLMNLVPFVVMLGIMYVLMIRPQMRKQKAHREFVTKLKRGDEVLTASGILGRVEGLTDAFITLEIAPGVRIKVLRSQVASFLPTAGEGNEVKA